ncbi:MAG: autotransporter domain-containing protein, partial [Akkermansia sp.]|nr:autotransporter domain-containing protein [Akkermansia sp.]
STPSLVLQNATLSAGSLTFEEGTSLVLNNVDNKSDAMISISTSLTMSDSVVLALSGAYTGDKLEIAVADYTGSASDWFTKQDPTKITVDSLLWNVSNLDWKKENGKLYVTGTTQKKEVLDISNSDMVLDNETALGTDIPVVSTGTTTLDTAENVTVILPGTIQNGGDLTISGSYDASKLVEITVEDTRVSVYGKEGNNGFFREGGKALVVVDNKGNATLAVTDGTTVQGKDGESLKLYASGLATSKELDYSNYQIADGDHKASMSDIQGMRPDSAESLTITMSNGTLVADEDAADIQASGGTIETKGDVTVGGKLAGTTSVVVGEGSATISGEHDYTGDTIISGENAKLTVGHDKALGKSKMQLHNKGTLDLNGKAVSNYLNVTGCELHNASAYTGTMDVSGDLTICGTDATADTVNMVKGGSISASDTETLTVNTLTVSGGDSSINADLIINPDGRIVLNDGSVLTVNSTVTLGDGASIVLNGDYASGDTIMVVKDGINTTEGSVTLSYGYGRYIVVGDVVKLSAVFNQNKATACTLTNWGIATASRAVVNAVRGQRSNTGCIADGKGTAWVASLGSKHEINGSDIDISGAAVGADMQVGRNSRMGIALGYAEGEVQPTGLRQVDQEGSYLAVYGEHGLKKLSPTSCLSMDWVAAYGVTD